MKECKILTFSQFSPDKVHTLKGQPGAFWVTDFPEAEKFLEKYLNMGFVVKNMTRDGGHYSFYLERDV